MELEEERKSLARRKSLTTSMEQALAHQHECLKTPNESAVWKEASLQEKTRQLEVAQGALDAQVQEAVQEAARKLQEDQRMGAQRIIDWAGEAKLSSGATWDESNPSGGAASFDC